MKMVKYIRMTIRCEVIFIFRYSENNTVSISNIHQRGRKRATEGNPSNMRERDIVL